MKTLLLSLSFVLFSGLAFGQSKKTYTKQELSKLYEKSYLNEVQEKEGMNALFNISKERYLTKAQCLINKYKYKKSDFVHLDNKKEYEKRKDYIMEDTVLNMDLYPPNGADLAPKCFPEQTKKSTN